MSEPKQIMLPPTHRTETPQPAPVLFPCVYRGPQNGFVVCAACKGVELATFVCLCDDVPEDSCVIRRKPVDRVAKCQDCEHRKE